LNRVRKPEKGKKVGDPKVDGYKFAWFSNPDFRRAMSMAVDRDAMIRGPYYGYAVKGWAIFSSGNPRWYDSTLTAPDFDPEGAKKLLDQLGLKDKNGDGVREDAAGHDVAFTMIYNGDNKLRQAVATLLQDDLAKVGVKLTPSGLDFNTLITKTRNEFDYEVCLGGLAPRCRATRAWGRTSGNRAASRTTGTSGQPHPETRAEARIDSLYQVNVGTYGPGGAPGGLSADGADHERRVLRGLAADAAAQDPGPDPLRQRAPEPDAAPHPVELRHPVRQAPGAAELSVG
jgi:peptide/nickel transport system substrate-binding protein